MFVVNMLFLFSTQAIEIELKNNSIQRIYIKD